MAMGTQRSKALHNFTMPCGLRWGNQRFLRCMKVNSDGQASALHRFTTNNSSGSADHHHHIPTQQRRTTRDRDRERDKDSEFVNGSPKVVQTLPLAADGGRRFSDDADDDGIAAMREKVMLDLQTAADKLKDAILKDGEVSISPPLVPQPPPPPPPAPASAEGETSRPWNLRTRRAACKMPASGFASSRNGGTTAAGGGNDGGGAKDLKVDVPRPNSGFSQMRASASAVAHKSPLRDGSGMATTGEKKERPKFSVPLSKRDIEEDFFAMVGHRPARRPKKRAKIVQKQLDTLFPGLWLTEVTPDMYKVPESTP
ncbi:hypothetical protein CDL12_20491 [Handroanthus impetiginosus]|uniref:DUF1639 domain-containing protein n=1 Tax=Handroanthus impetiginosus TaxID=429701 RepID=A0A2G9GNX0_9LAMI|nr:hypothetical protein CDL12_20491 [Handroanthus impetiginosus]